MRIGEVAKAAGIGIDAVRFYEREGLIPKPARRPSGYREYTPEVVVSLRFIKRAKGLGFSLKEISELIRL
jgi:MerR family copper efflux transcriptional regulator